MKKSILVLILLFTLLFSVNVFAQPRHMKLLAVSEIGGNISGSVADLYLEILPGQNRVFIETYPLTRLDTQISTRFAKDIACSIGDIDCSDYNFIYTIKAQSTIIGGPSAGAALSILTAASLLNVPIREDVAMTGTINSGGLIGPVSGIPEKIEAAAKSGIKLVLIPKGTRHYKQITPNQIQTNASVKNQTINVIITKVSNNTIDLVEHGIKYNISVEEVADINNAFYIFSGKYLYQNHKNVTKESYYSSVMQDVASELCERSASLKKLIPKPTNNTYTIMADDLLQRAENASFRGDYYSKASFCFAANTKLQIANMQNQNLSNLGMKATLLKVKSDVDELSAEVNNISLSTLTDVQTYMIVQERIDETFTSLKTTEEKLADKNVIEQLAYTVERLQSAQSWKNFFGLPGKKFEINEEQVKDACNAKLAEAHERYDYVNTMFPNVLANTQQTLVEAEENAFNNQYLICLYKASKAKSEADLVLNTMGVSEDYIDSYTKNKLVLVKEGIARVQEKGIFPILGYSYWEYAASLKDYDKNAALLFLEYAQEMTHMNLYFTEKKTEAKTPLFAKIKYLFWKYERDLILFGMGFIWGGVIAICMIKLIWGRKTKVLHK